MIILYITIGQPLLSCVDPASDIQICSIVIYYFRISLAGSPDMDLLDVADSYHKCSQYLFCRPNIPFESIFGALQVPGKVDLNLLGVREGSQNSLQSRKVPSGTLAPGTLARVHSRIHSRHSFKYCWNSLPAQTLGLVVEMSHISDK